MLDGIGCTITAIYDQGRYYLGSNSDNPWEIQTKVCVKKGEPHQFVGTQLVCPDEYVPWANMITRGVNDKGIAFTFAFVDCPVALKGGEGLNFKDFGTYILGYFSSLGDIQKYLEEARILAHGNFFFADAEGNLLVCELHPEQRNFNWNPKEKIIKTNHFFNLPFFEKHHISETNSVLRYQSGLEEMEKESSEKSTVSYLKGFLSNHRNDDQNASWGSSTCNHGTEAGTVSSEIIDPKNRTLWYCYGPPCGQSDKLNSWGEYIPFSLEKLSSERDLTTTNGKILSEGF